MTELEEYYNKFNEDKRLTKPHGQVEYRTSMKYIHAYLEELDNKKRQELVSDTEEGADRANVLKILDIGAGTGRYALALAGEGYDVTAVEPVRHNLSRLKQKDTEGKVKAYQGNALCLKRFEDESFDLTLLFGPMYHLFAFEDKLKALREAIRVTKPGGYILVAYIMNEYGVLSYGFKEGHIRECLADGRLDENFHCVSEPKDLYDYVRLEDIGKLNESAGVRRIKIVAADGPANYMRPLLHRMDDETFELFMQYHLSTCERPELLGASAHVVDILQKNTTEECVVIDQK
ncbi:MAG: methyltransferase domain-containing protein [Lachnospiraceae bacterium]